MKVLGEPKKFLGIEIERNREEKYIVLNQSSYIESILDRFKMTDCNPQNTPMVTRQAENRSKRRKLEELESSECEQSSITRKAPYREAIGSLMYLANGTRPDISFAVHYLARKQLCATEDDWKYVKRILRYLKGTVNLNLKYKGNSDDLEAFSDASFKDNDDSTSSGGYIIRLFGDVIAWRSHKQKYVTLSTCQAEYLAMSDACQEIISLDKAIRFVIENFVDRKK
ncbi:uncharacterized protein LOC141533529 isoform X1 [Cotesia typhae]|uniref:uncharacterized protein LOC141533529 isoform X1 n=1 Tax=Cotesia typhae TaxID=2053667 RepID=UPI003D692583